MLSLMGMNGKKKMAQERFIIYEEHWDTYSQEIKAAFEISTLTICIYNACFIVP